MFNGAGRPNGSRVKSHFSGSLAGRDNNGAGGSLMGFGVKSRIIIEIGCEKNFACVSTSLYLPQAGESFSRALLYGYELPPSFPPQTLALVFLRVGYTG